MTFRLLRLQFTFQALDPLRFPPGKAGNTLRGAFGLAARQLHCAVDCPGSASCTTRNSCIYARIFEPTPAWPGPSGLATLPRPFVIRANHLDGRDFKAGEQFSFLFHLFSPPFKRSVAEAFESLRTFGLGPRRSRVWLQAMAEEEIAIDLLESAVSVGRILVKFVTPTQIKGSDVPVFRLLASRVRDRVSTLSALYGPGQVPIDFEAYGRRAASVTMERCDIVQVEAQRRSSRTGQVHSIGGFVGEAEYRGDLDEFIPFFRAATYTGVGMKASWGNGQIQIEY